jgi:divalent metal cation (Fe/Co/Zn/Cd) transporter
VALITASIACNVANNRAWWVDPAGAILISVAIIYRWISVMQEQIQKVVGHTAPPEFISQVVEIAANHDQRLVVDCTRAYHFGARYNVEMEVVLPGRMTVMESHDIALALQHKIESFDNVERAFVHVDHQERDGLEHKVERELNKNSNANNSNQTTNILHNGSPP